MDSPIVTLTSDWGFSDFFIGKVKGRLLALIPNVRIVDIAHDQPPFQLFRTAFIVTHTCFEFPQDSIHIIDVSSRHHAETDYLAIRCEGQYYIMADNGLPGVLFQGKHFEAVSLAGITWDTPFRTFPACDLFCRVAAMIASGFPLSEIGSPVPPLVQGAYYEPIINSDSIQAHATYVDRYGNIDLDISFERFDEVAKMRSFVLSFNDYKITRLTINYSVPASRHASYSERLILTISSTGYLQIAMIGGSAADLLGLRNLGTVSIQFLSD